MRIAVVTPLFPISSEPYRGAPIYKTVRALAGMAEVEAFYVAPKYPPGLRPRSYQYKPADPGWQPLGVKTTYLTYPTVPVLGRTTNPWASYRAMLPALRRFQPRVLLSYWLFPEGLGATMAGAALGVPVLVGSRGSDLLRIADPVTRKGTARAVRAAAATLVVSEELKRAAVAMGAPAERVHTIVNGCDRQIFYPADRLEARRELGIDPDAPVLLFVGHLLASKGVPELVEAFRAIRGRQPRAQLAVIGEGALEGTLAAAAVPGITLAGPKKPAEIARWMAACDVFTLPSHSEGCPNVVLEALACGRPVVGSSAGAIPDLLDEASGILTRAGDAEALRTALEQALERARRGAWDAAEIAAKHGRSWEDTARETLDVCRMVLPSPYRNE